MKKLLKLIANSIPKMIAFLGLFISFASNAGRYFRSKEFSIPFILSTVLLGLYVNMTYPTYIFNLYLGGVFVLTLVFAGILGGRYYSNKRRNNNG